MKTRIAVLISIIVLLGVVSTGSARADPGTITILNNATGGDCSSVGIWDSATKTCTLSMDLIGSIVIADDDISLDGNGHTLTGPGNGTGVNLSWHGGITIKNLTVRQFGGGTQIAGVGGNTITNCTIINNGIAISAIGSLANTITKNTISNNGAGIGLAHQAGGYIADNTISDNTNVGIGTGMSVNGITVTRNTINNNDIGIHIADGVYNTITRNTIAHNRTLGISLGGFGFTDHTRIYNNNFLSNPSPQVQDAGGGDDVFNLDKPIGGNFWDNYHIPAQGCTDTNNDGFCDAPYVFPGGQDNLPWTRQNGWFVVDVINLIKDKEDACNRGWISQKGICNSLDAKLNAVKASIERGEFGTARNQLNAFLNELSAQQGKAVNQQAYELLKADAQNVIDELSEQ